MPEHNPGQMGGTMRLGKRRTLFQTKNSIMSKALLPSSGDVSWEWLVWWDGEVRAGDVEWEVFTDCCGGEWGSGNLIPSRNYRF